MTIKLHGVATVKDLLQDLKKACGILRKQKEPIYWAKINADDSKALGEKLGATQLPTVFYYKNGEKMKYEGALNEHGLTSWILEGRSLASMPMDLDTLENLRKTEHVFYAYFGPLEGKEFTMYQMIAKHDEFRNFTHTNDPAAIAKYNVKTPNIVAFRQFDEPVVHLTGEYERVNAIQFIREKGIAECIRFHEIDKLNIFRGKSTAVFLIADEEKHKKIIDTFWRAAKEDKSSMIYAYAGVATDDHKFLRKYINVFDKGAPVLCLVHFEVAYGLMRFDYDEDANKLSTDDIKYFVKRFKSGALDRHYYDNQEDKWYHLTQPSTLTFENYEDVVLDTDNDVLVYYFTLNEGERGSRIHKALNKLTYFLSL